MVTTITGRTTTTKVRFSLEGKPEVCREAAIRVAGLVGHDEKLSPDPKMCRALICPEAGFMGAGSENPPYV